MGNCQAIDAATLVIQHPNGKADKLYSPVNAAEIMKTNPGHYVALLLSTTLYPNPQCPNKTTTTSSTASTTANNSLRITRIKLLRPTDTLVLGHVYRLITTQEVTKGLCAKKQAKQNKKQPESRERIKESSEVDLNVKRSQLHRNRGRTSTWQPSLNSISEGGGGSGS
ncbi:uncharacterized protein [Euphorbia lathyris]|uniref:uncharacterized protein n=1 Tax=Euphorbia lathyris TaxID=212925 RepID=UPI0033142342